MIPSWCLLNVLNYLGRYELDLLQETNKRVKRVINQQFTSKPYFFRAGLKLLIECRHGEILLKLYSSIDCFVPNLREWQKDKYDEEIGDFSCNHFYSVEEMRPFLTEFLRVSNTEIVITTSPYAPDLDIIAPLESVSHVWAGQRLNINGYTNGTGASFDQIFRSSMILRCRELYLHCKTFGMQFHKYPDLFNLHQFHYCKLIKSEVLLDIIQQNARYPESRTTLVLYVSRLDDILYGIETLRNDFLASSKKCRVQVIVEIGLPPESCGQLEFLLENNRTKETLQLSWITRKEVKDNFNVTNFEQNLNVTHKRDVTMLRMISAHYAISTICYQKLNNGVTISAFSEEAFSQRFQISRNTTIVTRNSAVGMLRTLSTHHTVFTSRRRHTKLV